MKTFVISLKEARERQDNIQTMMDGLGLPFEFFEAVDGREFDVAQHEAHNTTLRRLFFGRDMKGGEIGILLSHRSIYEKMIEEKIDIALVLEDDVRLHEDAPEVLKVLENGPRDFELIRFLGSKKVMGSTQKTKRNVLGEYNLNRLLTSPGGAHAYVVTLSGAKKLYKASARNHLPIDTLMGHSWRTGVENLIIKPGLSYQDAEMPQYIGEARFNKSDLAGGWTRALFPVTRAWFKFSESIMKRLYYFMRNLKDQNGPV
ncbi:MAG: glycosyltransferase family 25 protein [Pseudomonadota bacterium]